MKSITDLSKASPVVAIMALTLRQVVLQRHACEDLCSLAYCQLGWVDSQRRQQGVNRAP